MNRRLKLYFIIFLVSFFLCPFSLFAKEFKHVKIATYNLDTFFNFDENNQAVSGYAFEYISTIANYAGWEVEFIKEENFAACLKKIINCEVDVAFDITKIPERESLILFPNFPMGTENFILYAATSNKDISPNDLQTFSGKKIGVPINTYEADLLATWCQKNNIRSDIILYSDREDSEQDLLSGKIDMVCEVGMQLSSEISPVITIGSAPYYLTANKNRSDLLRDINEAQRKLQNSDPYFISRLSEKYFYKSSAAKALSQDEWEWLTKHDTLKVGLLTNFFPFTFYDKETGVVSGLPIDLVNLFLSKLGLQNLKIKYYPVESVDELLKDLAIGKTDIILPCYENVSLLRNTNFITSRNVYFSLMGAIYNPKVTFQNAFKKIGVLKSSIAFYFIKEHYPQSEILTFNTLEECMDALKVGKVSGTICSLTAFRHFFKEEISPLQIRELYEDCKIAFGARKEDISLISTLNRARALTQDTEIFSIEQRYNISTRQTILSFLRSHFLIVLAVFFSIFIIISTAFILLFRTHKRLIVTSAVAQKQKEKLQLQQTILFEALEEANEASDAKTTFLFNMSHDLRTPMNAVIGFCNMASKNLSNIEYARNCLDKLRNAGEFLLLLLNDILDMSKLESGKLELSETEADITQLFNAIEPMLQYTATDKNIRLDFTITKIKNRLVYLDKERLCKILNNLIENALSYNNEGGWVKVSLCQTEEFSEGNPVYSFTVEDNGIGMSEEFQQQMYEPFAREQNSTQTGIPGTGLGLSFCNQVIKLMKGSISCKSKKDEGTQFTLKIPFRISEKNEEPAFLEESFPNSQVSFAGKKCLIVEDNELNREILADILEEKGIVIDTAENGEIAVQKIRQLGSEHYDFILMDIQMPVMNGYEATKAIRAMSSIHHIPIIAISANAFEDDKQKSLHSGMDDHIAKPVDTELLLKTIAQYL